MALVRGVENGFAMARAAKTGFVTAPTHMAASCSISSTFIARSRDGWLTNIPVGPGPTFYTRFGDWFGWLCVMRQC